jgi:hypothetical protein
LFVVVVWPFRRMNFKVLKPNFIKLWLCTQAGEERFIQPDPIAMKTGRNQITGVSMFAVQIQPSRSDANSIS